MRFFRSELNWISKPSVLRLDSVDRLQFGHPNHVPFRFLSGCFWPIHRNRQLLHRLPGARCSPFSQASHCLQLGRRSALPHKAYRRVRLLHHFARLLGHLPRLVHSVRHPGRCSSVFYLGIWKWPISDRFWLVQLTERKLINSRLALKLYAALPEPSLPFSCSTSTLSAFWCSFGSSPRTKRRHAGGFGWLTRTEKRVIY